MEPLPPPETEVSHRISPVPAIVASVLIAGLVAGGGVYTYERTKQTKANDELQAQINTLKNQVAVQQATSTPSPTPPAQATATPVVDKYADWHTYENAAHGYSIKYPSDWAESNEFKQGADDLVLSSAQRTADLKRMAGHGGDPAPNFILRYYASPQALPGYTNGDELSNATSVTEWLDKQIQRGEGDGYIFSYKAKTVAGYDGYEAQQSSIGDSTYWYIQKNGHVYAFDFDDDDVRQIVDTFKIE